jgi:hypothetical protein
MSHARSSLWSLPFQQWKLFHLFQWCMPSSFASFIPLIASSYAPEVKACTFVNLCFKVFLLYTPGEKPS